MRHRYIILLAAVLAVAVLALIAAPGMGQKTAPPATTGGQGLGPMAAPSMKQGPPAASAMPTGKATMAPTAMATMKPSPAMKATAKPTLKSTPVPTGMATGGRTGERAGERVGGGARVGGGTSGAYFAKVVNYGFVTQTISPGGTINGYVVIQNNGNDVINDALISIAVLQQGAAGTVITNRDQTLNGLNIAPGDQKRVEFSINTPSSIAAGSYDVRATVQANGQQIDTFTKAVTVT